MRRYSIKAVHEQDLGKLLSNLGLSELIDRGELRCSVCGDIVNPENLLCIYPSGAEVRVCCKKAECYETVLRETQ